MENVNIFLIPTSGLGNRMRAISSFIYFKSLLNADLKVIWIPDKGLNIGYQELFQKSSEFELLAPEVKYKFFINRKSLTENNFPVIRWIMTIYHNILCKALGFDCLLMDKDVKKGVDHLKKICARKKNILVITGNQCLDYQDGFRFFVPAQEVASKVKAARENFRDHMIGIHIRRTDHKKAIENSPVGLFEQKIQAYLKVNPENFGAFLATDDPETAEYLQSKFPDVVVTYQKTFGRDTREGMVDAAVEMFLLAGTKKIYGSYWSSFSGVAKRIYGTEIEILHV